MNLEELKVLAETDLEAFIKEIADVGSLSQAFSEFTYGFNKDYAEKYHNGFYVKTEEYEGGSEGEGEYVHRVFSVWHLTLDEPIVILSCGGSYYSYDGTNWDESATRVYRHSIITSAYKEVPADEKSNLIDQFKLTLGA